MKALCTCLRIENRANYLFTHNRSESRIIGNGESFNIITLVIRSCSCICNSHTIIKLNSFQTCQIVNTSCVIYRWCQTDKRSQVPGWGLLKSMSCLLICKMLQQKLIFLDLTKFISFTDFISMLRLLLEASY